MAHSFVRRLGRESEELPFEGFDPEAVRMLDQLPDWAPERYDREKPRLRAGVVEPGAALIQAVAERLDRDLSVVRRSSVSPLHRDLRFAPAGATRYKDHLLLTTWQGVDKKSSPILFIRIDAQSVGFASGLAFDKGKRERWRKAVAGTRGRGLEASLAKLRKRPGFELAGEALKRVPPPWAPDHPRADWLRLNGIQVRLREPLPASLAKPSFASWCATRLRALLPVHDWLVAELG